jgi:hypothetical protein
MDVYKASDSDRLMIFIKFDVKPILCMLQSALIVNTNMAFVQTSEVGATLVPLAVGSEISCSYRSAKLFLFV